MANSLIDDIIQGPYSNGEQSNNSNKSKKKKSKILIIFIFLILILIYTVIAILFYLKKNDKISPKLTFFEYLGKNNLGQVLNFETHTSLYEKMSSESYELNSKITFDVNSDSMKISNTEINVNSKNDVQNQKSFLEAIINYSNNELFNLKFLSSKDAIAIKSDEVVVKYVGTKYENLSKVISKITSNDETNSYFSLMNIEELLNSKTFNIEIPENIWQKYIDVLNKNIEENSFSEKKVTLERSSGNIDVMEYTMSINESKAVDVVAKLLQTLETDEELLNIILEPYNNLGISTPVIKMMIDNIINNLYAQEIDDSHIYTIKLYVNNNQTLKVSIDLANKITFDVDYEYGDKENSIIITTLSKELNVGIILNIKKTVSDFSERIDIVLNMIENSEIVGKLTINTNLVDSQTLYEAETNIKLNYNNQNADIVIASNINFNTVEVEDLIEDNCLFIDDLDEQTFNATINAIEERCNEVIEDKKTKLSLIDTHVNPTVIEQQDPNQNIDREQKESAKQKLIESIQNEMIIARDNGEIYTIQNLQTLNIEGSNLEVSISDNLAVVKIDGFVFNIDSDFNLTE